MSIIGAGYAPKFINYAVLNMPKKEPVSNEYGEKIEAAPRTDRIELSHGTKLGSVNPEGKEWEELQAYRNEMQAEHEANAPKELKIKEIDALGMQNLIHWGFYKRHDEAGSIYTAFSGIKPEQIKYLVNDLANDLITGFTKEGDVDSDVIRYAKTVANWFYGDKATEADYKKLEDSMYSLISEVADRMRNQGDVSLESMNTRFEINGAELRLEDILEIQETTGELTSLINGGIGSQTNSMERFAQVGVLNAAAAAYAQTLPEEIGKLYEEGFNRLTERYITVCATANRNSDLMNSYYNRLTDAAEELYGKASGLDFSSGDLESEIKKFQDDFVKTTERRNIRPFALQYRLDEIADCMRKAAEFIRN